MASKANGVYYVAGKTHAYQSSNITIGGCRSPERSLLVAMIFKVSDDSVSFSDPFVILLP